MKIRDDNPLNQVNELPVPYGPKVINGSNEDDPLIWLTGWSPLPADEINFKTYKLQKAGPGRIEVRPTTLSFVFSYFTLSFGMLVILMGLANAFNLIPYTDPPDTSPLLLGLSFIAAGSFVLYTLFRAYRKRTEPLIFDTYKNYFWRGKFMPVRPDKNKDKHLLTALPQIAAIQVLPGFQHEKNASFDCFQVNLVLNTGHRIPVIEHDDQEIILRDALEISRLLDLPVWSAL